MVEAVTDYVARRMVEREQALAAQPGPQAIERKKRRRGSFWTFALGFVLGAAALFAYALFEALRGL
jgi:hypothetical protein